MNDWPTLNATEMRILTFCLENETVRSSSIAAALGYTPKYVRQVLVQLRIAFGVKESAALLLRAERRRNERTKVT